MTSPYNEKINKLNTALENVYLKKANLIDELSDILDAMIDSETPITVNINIGKTSGGVNITRLALKNYKTNEEYSYWTSNINNGITFTNNIASFLMPNELSFEDSVFALTITAYGQSETSNFYLYDLEDNDNDKIINVNMNDLPQSPPSE